MSSNSDAAPALADPEMTTAKPLLDVAWTILDAANDLHDSAAVEACRRVIDATFRGSAPEQSDISVVLDFFN